MESSARTVTANGLDFRVIDEGQGHPVVLLHGFPDTADMWRNQVRALADAAIASSHRTNGDVASRIGLRVSKATTTGR